MVLKDSLWTVKRISVFHSILWRIILWDHLIEFVHCFRMWVPKIEEILYKSQRANRTFEWNHFHVCGENRTTICNATKMYCQFSHLLHRRFWKWFISIAIPIVVNVDIKLPKLLLDDELENPLFLGQSFEGFRSIQIIQLVISLQWMPSTSYLAYNFSSLPVLCQLELEDFGL